MPYFRTIRFFISISCLLLIVSMVISCAPKRKAIDQSVEIERFEFLQDGKTNRQEIIDHLGLPASIYENGRIVIYYWHDEKSKRYDIVLVFNENNVLKKHSVVRVR